MKELVIIGLGQIGRLFGSAALRAGYRVTPVLREDDPATVLNDTEAGTPILVSTGESALAGVVASIPVARRLDVILIQNELFQHKWREVGLAEPTVTVFWSYKKAGTPFLAGRRTGVYGPHSSAILDIHQHLDVDAVTLADVGERDDELIGKYAFILTINALGVLENKTLGEWLEDGPEQVDALSADAVRIGAALAERDPDMDEQKAVIRDAMERLSAIPAAGRTAQQRVERAMAIADERGVEVHALGDV